MLPEWGKADPHLTGRATVDECVRQLVAMGANPERIAILDNFCMGNPDEVSELGALVETCKGMAKAAEAYGTPFVSGKDSFYNYFKTEEGPISIPVTLLVSGFGVVEKPEHVVGASFRGAGNKLHAVGYGSAGLRGSVFARTANLPANDVISPFFDEATAWKDYQRYYELVCRGLVLSAHDISEGGLAGALSEMTFSGRAGVSVDLRRVRLMDCEIAADVLFGETPGRIVFEVAPEHSAQVEAAGFPAIGETTSAASVVIGDGTDALIDLPVSELKPLWKDGLTRCY
jgi:phosphoribosylformylglycinamidine synthase